MSQYTNKTLIALISCCLFLPVCFVGTELPEKRCCSSSLRASGMWKADCDRMKLREFPKCLPYHTKKLKLSHNQIQEVKNEDLRRYPYMMHLYLMDNLIVNLDDNVFRKSTRLRTVDLSVNGLKKVPPTLFQLPSLTTLYLNQNLNINVAKSINEAIPIERSSLSKLDMSYITEDGTSTEFPDFRELPLLEFLNITGVNFTSISPRHFCGLCNLKILVSTNISAQFKKPCDCFKINRWLQEKKVKFTKLQCPNNKIDCSNQTIDIEDLQVYSDCRRKYAIISRWLHLEKLFDLLRTALFAFLVIGFYAFFSMRENVIVPRREILRNHLNRDFRFPLGLRQRRRQRFMRE